MLRTGSDFRAKNFNYRCEFTLSEVAGCLRSALTTGEPHNQDELDVSHLIAGFGSPARSQPPVRSRQLITHRIPPAEPALNLAAVGGERLHSNNKSLKPTALRQAQDALPRR